MYCVVVVFLHFFAVFFSLLCPCCIKSISIGFQHNWPIHGASKAPISLRKCADSPESPLLGLVPRKIEASHYTFCI